MLYLPYCYDSIKFKLQFWATLGLITGFSE
jgi:hypothetical protein